MIQSLCPDLYFFFGGFHLLFSAYMWAYHLRSSTPFSLLPPGSLVYPGARSTYQSKSEAEGSYPPPHLCSSTGSAGLIQTIRMYIGHHWVAAILGTLATVGWTIQGAGNAIYFVQVSSLWLNYSIAPKSMILWQLSVCKIYKHHNAAGHTMEKVSIITAPSEEWPCVRPVWPILICSGQSRASHTWRKSIFHARMKECIMYL